MDNFDKVFPVRKLTSDSDQRTVDHYRELQKRGYVAALKFVLSLVEPVGDQYGFTGELVIPDSNIKRIKKELQ